MQQLAHVFTISFSPTQTKTLSPDLKKKLIDFEFDDKKKFLSVLIIFVRGTKKNPFTAWTDQCLDYFIIAF